MPGFKTPPPTQLPNRTLPKLGTNVTVDVTVTPPTDSLEEHIGQEVLETGMQNTKDFQLRYKNFPPVFTLTAPDTANGTEDIQLVLNLSDYAKDFNNNINNMWIEGLPNGSSQNYDAEAEQLSISLPQDYDQNINTILKITDGEYTIQKNLNLIIQPVNDAPILDNIADFNLDYGDSTIISFDDKISDVDNTLQEIDLTANYDNNLEVIIDNVNKTAKVKAIGTGQPVITWRATDPGSLYDEDQSIVTINAADIFQGTLTDFVLGDGRKGKIMIDGNEYQSNPNGTFEINVQPQSQHQIKYWLTDAGEQPSSFIVTANYGQGQHLNLDLAAASDDNLVWTETGPDSLEVTFQEMREFHDYGNIGLFGANWELGLKKPVLPDSIRQVYIVYGHPEINGVMQQEWAQNIKDSLEIDILDKVAARFGEDVRIPIHIGYDGDPLRDEVSYIVPGSPPLLMPKHGWFIVYINNDIPGGNGSGKPYDDNKDNLIDRGYAVVRDSSHMISANSFYGVVEEEFLTALGYIRDPPDGDPIPEILTKNQTILHNFASINKPTPWDYIWIFANFNPSYKPKSMLDDINGMSHGSK